MKGVNIYLTFNGNCEEAFEFYKSILGGEYLSISRFSDMPPMDDMPPMPEEHQNRIMHVTLPIKGDQVIMGSDTGGEWSSGFKMGNNFSISLNAESREEADQVFAGLSEGGKVTMPMQDTFWESYFGMFEDKFGVQWMVSFDKNSEK